MLSQPFALTLWTLYQIEEVERIERLVDRDGRFDQAGITAAAVLDGKAFQRARGMHLDSLRVSPYVGKSDRLDQDAAHLAALDAFATRNLDTHPLS